eukprot:Sspe_Gene.95146::Locus_67460_Transcript_1_1_Confidence_1.000_Length_335::g.95146::m.95146
MAWSQHVDVRSGGVFWHNHVSHTSHWHPPTGLPSHDDAEEGRLAAAEWAREIFKYYDEDDDGYWKYDEMKAIAPMSPEEYAERCYNMFVDPATGFAEADIVE